jgi:hypothetical protein
MATPHRLSHPFHPSHKARTLSILFNTAVIQFNFYVLCVCVCVLELKLFMKLTIFCWGHISPLRMWPRWGSLSKSLPPPFNA